MQSYWEAEEERERESIRFNNNYDDEQLFKEFSSSSLWSSETTVDSEDKSTNGLTSQLQCSYLHIIVVLPKEEEEL